LNSQITVDIEETCAGRGIPNITEGRDIFYDRRGTVHPWNPADSWHIELNLDSLHAAEPFRVDCINSQFSEFWYRTVVMTLK